MQKNLTTEALLERISVLEHTLHRFESERNSILDGLPFAAWAKDQFGKFIHVNQLYVSNFQLDYQNVIGKTVFELFPYELAQVFHQEDVKVIEQKHAINFQTKRESEWYSTIKWPIFSHEGNIIGTSGFERNINDNIETLNSLRKERDLLLALMDNIPDTIYFKDLKSRFIRINKAKAEELGLKNPYDVIGKSDFDYVAYDQALINQSDEALILDTGVPLISKEEHIKRKDGNELWVSSTKSPIRDEKGNITGLVGISRDITDQKNLIHLLHEERDFLQVLMDYIPFTIYFKDLHCKFTRINMAQARVVGVANPEDAIGKSDFDYFSPQTAQVTYEDEMRIFETGEAMIAKVEQIKDTEGNMSWVSATKIPVKDNFGNITGMVGMSIDVTEKRIAEENLREAKEKAEESDRLKTAFLANMSHEIRTPMNGIIGFSNLLRNTELSENERNEFLNHITSCGNTLLNLIDDIIDISKIEAGQIKIRISESNINDIFDEVKDTFEAARQREGKEHLTLSCVTSLDHQLSSIQTDPFRFRQIISNLIGNALKFTIEGSIEFGYTLDDSENLRFYVKDTGIGIPKDKQGLIFERFGQVVDSTFFINQKGTGLGLAISSNLVKLLGGHMWVESDPGKGSTFFFTLPYNHVEAHLTHHSGTHANPSHKLDYSGYTILVAEDEEINYLYFKQILKNTGATLLWAKNGLEAVEFVKKTPEISVILMDCKMPVMDGYKATDEIKQMRPTLPVIAQTAFAMADELEKSVQAGCDAYLSKPIRVKLLFEMLNKFLMPNNVND